MRIDSVPIPVIKKKDGSLQLEAGQAHGVCDSDRFAIHSLASRECDAKVEADPVTAKVTSANALTSDLKLLNPMLSSVGQGSIATALTRDSLRRFPIQLELGLPYSSAWTKAAQERQSLDIYEANEQKPERSCSFRIALAGENELEIRDGSNQRISNVLTTAHSSEENIRHVLDVVEHLVKFKLVEILTNDSLVDSAHSFRKSFDVQLISPDGQVFHSGCLQLGWLHTGCSHPQCLVEVKNGEKVKLAMRNKERKGGNNLYLYLYSLGACWDVENIVRGGYDDVPPCGSNQNDEDFSQGTSGEWRKEIAMTVPSRIISRGQDHCDDIIKVFLTSQPTSFDLLELPEIGKLVEERGTSGKRGKGGDHLVEDWAALSFRIRTKK